MRETDKGSIELRFLAIIKIWPGFNRIFIESLALLSDAGFAFTSSQ